VLNRKDPVREEHRTFSPGFHSKGSVGQTRRLLSLKESATLLGVSTVSVRRFIWAGRLPVVRLTRKIQVELRDLERLIDAAKDRLP